MKTSLLTVSDEGDPNPVIATIGTRKITIGEDASIEGWPTTDYLVKGADPGSAFMRKAAGTTFSFEFPINRWSQERPGFRPGEIVGYVQTVTGSTTFYQIED